jgi:predicted metalloprotease with PDZ domain
VLSFFGAIHPPVARLIAAAVEHTAGLNTPDQLREIGFEVTLGPASILGLAFQDHVGPSIYGVFDDSPAGAVGLAPGDMICAINNHAFSAAALTWVGGRSEPVTLSVRRGHRDLAFTLTPAPRERIQSIRWKGNQAQTERIVEWLHQKELDLAFGEKVDLDFYENFHGVEIVV